MSAIENFGRVSRRKSRTREKLLEAVHGILMSKPVEKISIQDITEKADVGTGTFYNHFSSKQDLLEAVADILFLKITAGLDHITKDVNDPAEVACFCYRFIVRQMAEQSNWCIMRELTNNYMRDKLLQRARRDTVIGIESGRFDIADINTFLRFICSVILGVITDIAEGQLSVDQSENTVVYYLRLFGISHEEAVRLSEIPLPECTLS